MAPSALSKFSNYAASQGRPDLAELLPTEEGAPCIIELSAANASRLLDDEDAEVVAYVVGVSGALTVLNLYRNNISDAGAAALADALRVNGALTTLVLEDNRIQDAGAAALGDALCVNGALTALYLEGNKINENSKMQLCNAVQGRAWPCRVVQGRAGLCRAVQGRAGRAGLCVTPLPPRLWTK